MYATSLVTLMPGYLNGHDVDHIFIVGRALWFAQGDDDVVSTPMLMCFCRYA